MTRQMDRALKGVETMPDNGSAARLLGLNDPVEDPEAGEIAQPGEGLQAAE